MKPRWRWLLYCLSLDLWWRTQWRWLKPVMSWACDVPAWWTGGEDCSGGSGEEPF